MYSILRHIVVLLIAATVVSNANASSISWQRIPTDDDLIAELKPNTLALIGEHHKGNALIDELIEYLRERSSERYYFNWKNFASRFEMYRILYPDNLTTHDNLARYHMSRYAPETNWQLPAVNLLGEDVTAYELRHLARQQKSFDMALMYFYSELQPAYPDYFVRQAADLNSAFSSGAYDDEGNGIYESYRAGRRIHNWLFCHHAYLAGSHYTSKDQLLLIKTFLHHGAQLQKRTARYRPGNHHTKGLVALFELAVLFSDFKISDQWREQALDGLSKHIAREVNDDGFQFERSVHYHMGDIENYFRVYRLAVLNNISLPEIFESQFRKMFEALVQLAQPNRRLPVLQDDTDSPFAENNQIDHVMTIATLVFGDARFRYFANDEIPADIYWLLRPEQFENLHEIDPVKPSFGSTALKSSGYYCMRNGWDEDDLYMTISAGLSTEKPDHQHGDMLGIVAYANGHEILPNYQVRYKFDDYRQFKNSWVKNVALVDSIPLGQRWKQNRGKSGFGKWLSLPVPEVIHWRSTPGYDYFAGTHNAYDSLNVSYYREVLFIKDGFWIVRDHFYGDSVHQYQQIWQGHYAVVSNHLAFSQFMDMSGLEIIQLNEEIDSVETGMHRNKGHVVFSSDGQHSFVYTTLLHPYKKNEFRLLNCSEELYISGWRIEKNALNRVVKKNQLKTDAGIIMSHPEQGMMLFDFSFIENGHDSVRSSGCRSAIIEFIDGELKIVEKF